MEFSHAALAPAAAGVSFLCDSACVGDLPCHFGFLSLRLPLIVNGSALRTCAVFFLPPFFSESSPIPESQGMFNK